MSENNDMDDDPSSNGEKGADLTHDPVTGQFLKGHPGGPGRPRGSLDFMSVVRRKAKAKGVDLEMAIWAVTVGLIAAGKRGNPAAAKILLDRMCGIQEKASEVSVTVDARTAIGTRPGPPMPSGVDFSAYVSKFNEVAAKQGLLKASAEEMIDAAIEQEAEEARKRAELEELFGTDG